MIKQMAIEIEGIPYTLELDCSVYPNKSIAKIHKARILDDNGQWQPFTFLEVLFHELQMMHAK